MPTYHETNLIRENNIHLHYKTMSEDEKRANAVVLDALFKERQRFIMSALVLANQKDCLVEFTVKGDSILQHGGVEKLHEFTYAQTVFDIKDEMGPLDEYIGAIAGCPAYKKYEKDELHKFFYMNVPDCEQGEMYSPACEMLLNRSLQEEDIREIYRRLKKYEEYWDKNHTIGEIVVREMFVEHPNTPIEIIEDISKTRKLRDSYMFIYYGGYGGEDYEVITDLSEPIAKRLEKAGLPFSANLQKHILKREICKCEEKRRMNAEYHGLDPKFDKEFDEVEFSLKAKIKELKQQLDNLARQSLKERKTPETPDEVRFTEDTRNECDSEAFEVSFKPKPF